jgi:hypothetical protein
MSGFARCQVRLTSLLLGPSAKTRFKCMRKEKEFRKAHTLWLDRNRYKVIRGALDCAGVVGRVKSRSKYGSECSYLPVSFEEPQEGGGIGLTCARLVCSFSSQEAQEVEEGYDHYESMHFHRLRHRSQTFDLSSN